MIKREYEFVTMLDAAKIIEHVEQLKTLEVILTYERAQHIYNQHQQDYETILEGMKVTIDVPSYIYKDVENERIFYFIKKMSKNRNQNVVVKLSMKNDEKHPKNSVITSWIISDKHLRQLVKKHKMIYNSGSEK